MAYIDGELVFSNDQAITASADSTNVYDLLGAGYADAIDEMWCVVQVTETFDSLTSLDIKFSTGAATTLGTALHTTNVLLATLASGYEFYFRVPLVGKLRYIGMEYAVNGTNPSVGKLNAFLATEWPHGVK